MQILHVEPAATVYVLRVGVHKVSVCHTHPTVLPHRAATAEWAWLSLPSYVGVASDDQQAKYRDGNGNSITNGLLAKKEPQAALQDGLTAAI